MVEQLNMFGGVQKATPKVVNKAKRNWENAFQKWSDKQEMDGSHAYGKCGFGSMCDYCDDNTYGRPCVRALNNMCREKHIFIDYEYRNFEEIWNGVFNNG